MDATSILEILVIGALMGMLGQGARAVIGLKGMADDAKAQGLNPNDVFEAARLLTSFLIGALVGLVSALTYIMKDGTAAQLTWHYLVAWAAAAYAGTDALEGFVSQYLSPGASVQKLAAAKVVKPAVQQPATYPYNDAEKIVMAVLKAGPQVNDKTSLSDLGYANIENLYILAGQINDVIVPKGYEIDNSQIANWSTVGDVVKNVESATRVGAQS